MGLKPVLGNPLGGVVDTTDLETDKVPYTGATADIDAGQHSITTRKQSGTPVAVVSYTLSDGGPLGNYSIGFTRGFRVRAYRMTLGVKYYSSYTTYDDFTPTLDARYIQHTVVIPADQSGVLIERTSNGGLVYDAWREITAPDDYVEGGLLFSLFDRGGVGGSTGWTSGGFIPPHLDVDYQAALAANSGQYGVYSTFPQNKIEGNLDVTSFSVMGGSVSINGVPLSGNSVSLTTADIPDSTDKRYVTDAQEALVDTIADRVPYTGATGDVDLGTKKLATASVTTGLAASVPPITTVTTTTESLPQGQGE
jgi:hypothetical protein